MGKSLGSECNIEKVCFEPGTESLVATRRVSGRQNSVNSIVGDPMTSRKPSCQVTDLTYGMEKTFLNRSSSR